MSGREKITGFLTQESCILLAVFPREAAAEASAAGMRRPFSAHPVQTTAALTLAHPREEGSRVCKLVFRAHFPRLCPFYSMNTYKAGPQGRAGADLWIAHPLNQSNRDARKLQNNRQTKFF